MKLLLDQGLPRSAGALLREVGVDAVHAGEIGLASAEDSAILDRASSEERVVVTLDADFHALLAARQASGPSVIRIRLQGLRGIDLARVLGELLQECEEDLLAGAVVTVERGRARVRRLPLPR